MNMCFRAVFKLKAYLGQQQANSLCPPSSEWVYDSSGKESSRMSKMGSVIHAQVQDMVSHLKFIVLHALRYSNFISSTSITTILASLR